MQTNQNPLILFANTLQRAVENPQLTPDTVARLWEIREKLEAERRQAAFDSAMAAFQAECPIIDKPKKAHHSTYAPFPYIIQETRGLRDKHGFTFRFTSRLDQTLIHVQCFVRHREGHEEMSEFSCPIDEAARAMNASQKAASADTYAKRYAFCNAFGIVTSTGDDDGVSLGDPRGSISADSLKRIWWGSLGREGQAKLATPETRKTAFQAACEEVLKGPCDPTDDDFWRRNADDYWACVKQFQGESV